MMDHAGLDRLTLEQLREEARRYQLQDSGDRRSLIDTIMVHFERHAPLADFGVGHRDHARVSMATSRAAVDGEIDEPITASAMKQVIMSVTEDILRHQRELQNQQMEFLQRQQEQMALLTQVIVSTRENPGTSRATRDHVQGRESVQAQGTSPAQASTGPSGPQWSPNAGRFPNSAAIGNTIKWLATQIPPFGGAESENVNAWIKRVEKVAEIHAATDGAILLAASSKLNGSARRWYDIQAGPTIESSFNLRTELTKMFERKVPFYKTMARIEARSWNAQKETFDEYAIEKLTIMQQWALPVMDTINLLIGGIPQPMLRATALSLRSATVEHFLEVMRLITNGMAMDERKNQPQSAATRRNHSHAGIVERKVIITRRARHKWCVFIVRCQDTDNTIAQKRSPWAIQAPVSIRGLQRSLQRSRAARTPHQQQRWPQ